MDGTGNMIAANHAAAALLGRGLEGRSIDELSNGHSSILLTDLKTVAGGGSITLRLHDTAGSAQRLTCRVQALPGKDGSTNLYLIMIVGEQPVANAFSALNAELRDARAQQVAERKRHLETERQLEQIESFSHHAAHDLKTPLRQIDLLLSVLEEDYGDALVGKGQELIRQARGSTCRLQQLITDLLDRARIAESELETGALQLETLIDELLQSLEPSLVEAGATAHVVRPLGVVEGDAVLARQIVFNLLSNAIKYRAEDRLLRIDVATERASDGAFELIVRDNGQGFEEGFAERVFESFTRVGKNAVEGSGLGLASCRRMCRRLGWTIAASGRLGSGAEFRIRFADVVSVEAIS